MPRERRSECWWWRVRSRLLQNKPRSQNSGGKKIRREIYVVDKKNTQIGSLLFPQHFKLFYLNAGFYFNVLLLEGVRDAVWPTSLWRRRVGSSTTSTRIPASVWSTSGFLWVASTSLNHKWENETLHLLLFLNEKYMWRFSVQIIDEADRMIDSMHQLWLSQMVKAVFKSGSEPDASSIFRRTEPTHITAARYGRGLPLERTQPRKQLNRPRLSCLVCSLSPPQMPLQKLLFSATLTQNPEKLQQLGLHQPRLFSSVSGSAATAPALSQDRFDFPEGLTVRADREKCEPTSVKWGDPVSPVVLFLFSGVLRPLHTEQKAAAHPPLHPAHEAQPHPLFHQLQGDGAQVGEDYTSGTFLQLHHLLSNKLLFFSCLSFRLLLLVRLFGGVQAAEFSSRLSPGERKKTLKEFEQGKIQLWVEKKRFCPESDAMKPKNRKTITWN